MPIRHFFLYLKGICYLRRECCMQEGRRKMFTAIKEDGTWITLPEKLTERQLTKMKMSTVYRSEERRVGKECPV